MNRRTFLTGLLATTAAVPIVKVAPLSLSGVPIAFDLARDWRDVVSLVNVKYTAIYGSSETPMEFTGFIPAWSNK